MREIKFRAWDSVDEEMRGPMTITDIQDEGNWLSESTTILLQYTGLKDKNGVEIYEGDLVVSVSQDWCDDGKWKIDGYDKREPYRIQWAEGYAGMMFCGLDAKGKEYDFYGGFPRDCFVIGNIYENPELLTKEDRK